jgi:hypothetical protein
MGIADDPDVDDYYTRARGFPIAYSPDDDPEVVEEMRIAAAELKKGGDDSEDEATNDLGNSSDDETASDEGEGGAEEDWVDEDENVGEVNPGPSKRNKKMLSSVDKVRVSYCLV